MTSPSAKKILLFLVVFLASTALIAEDIPLRNWEVPPYTRSSGSSTGLRTMTDNTPGTSFTGVDPFRLVDTREAGFPAGYGTPALAAGVPRNFDLNSRPGFPAAQIPAGVEAYSLNVTVTNTAGAGFILIYPQGGAVPSVSSLNYVAGQTVANAVIVPAGTAGGVTVVAGVSGTDLIIDINGYFTDEHNTGQALLVFGTSVPGFFPGSMLLVSDASVGASFSNWTISASTTTGSAAVLGFMTGATGATMGVYGITPSTTAGASGVAGDATGGAGRIMGVYGTTSSADDESAGVLGLNTAAAAGDDTGGVIGISGSSAIPPFPTTNTINAGVQGMGVGDTSFASGGHFRGTGRGVQGARVDGTTGAFITAGVLGHSGTSGVHSFDDITAVGAKPFVEPHPVDPSKQLVYVALEGAEAGTYFRGRARFERGLARIAIPEHFRMLTEPEGLSIQITPIGEMTTFAVMKIDLDEIVVRGSRNVEFFYTVNGVRHNYKDFNPVQDNVYFVPGAATDTMAEQNARTKRLLRANGTLNEDGSINMETARRLGWDRIWENNERPAPRPEPVGASPIWDGRTVPTAPPTQRNP